MHGSSDGFLNRAWIFCSELGCAYNVLYISLILRKAKDREGGGICGIYPLDPFFSRQVYLTESVSGRPRKAVLRNNHRWSAYLVQYP